jgi:hypothetical protein
MNKEETKNNEDIVGKLRIELFAAINQTCASHINDHLEEMKNSNIDIRKYIVMILIDSLYSAMIGSISPDNKESENYLKRKFSSFVDSITKIYSK